MGAVKLYEGLATGLQPNTRIEANPGPLGLEDDLLGYTLNNHYKPLIKVKDMLDIERELGKDEDPISATSKVIGRRIAHHIVRHISKHEHDEIDVYGERYAGYESRAIVIEDGRSLETRVFPSLVLLRHNALTKRDGIPQEPEKVLRLDTLIRYKERPNVPESPYTHITAKSGDLDKGRADRITLGMLYLTMMLQGRHELVFVNTSDAMPKLNHLRKSLKSHRIGLGSYTLSQSSEDIRDAARYAIERYSEREAIIIPRRKLRLALAG